MRRAAVVGAWCLLLGVIFDAPSFAADAPSFRHEVIPILSRAGCNGGGCHGALAGKGGFRLSLFGYDPEADYRAITRDALGRRIELGEPGRSLLLAKPTTALPHKGGLRLEPGSKDYDIIARWIAAGAPPPREDDPELVALEVEPSETTLAIGESFDLAVRARYSDGVVRDVTRWARFTSTNGTVATVDENGK
ncbi:MAG TPA: hypothetical protein VK116_12970, partial [Planctomycetota bacterium]|nr:hypothetical protein [Planctomycetota bacterium]